MRRVHRDMAAELNTKLKTMHAETDEKIEATNEKLDRILAGLALGTVGTETHAPKYTFFNIEFSGFDMSKN